MKTYFLDTGYLLALELKSDENHALAQQHWQACLQAGARFITTSYVFDELVTFLNSRDQHAKAVQLGNRLMLSPSVKFIHVDEALFAEGWTHFQQYQDKRYSLTDCISFIVMKQFGLRIALAFDKHFAQAGFNKEP